MGDITWLIIIRFLSFFKRFLVSLKRYLFNSLLNIIEFATQILILMSYIYWIDINNVPNPSRYNISETINNSDKILFGQMEDQANKFDNYRQLQSFVIFGLFLGTMKYFFFSKRMSKLLDIFHHAKFDYLFYLIMFLIALMAFSVWAFFSFGLILDDYSTFQKSLIKCFLLLLGDINLEQMVYADSVIGPIFYFAFNVIFLKNSIF